MANITVEIEIDDDDGDENNYMVQDAIWDALKAIGYNVRDVKVS